MLTWKLARIRSDARASTRFLPRKERTIDEDWIRNAVRRNLSELAEEQTEHNHHEERLNDGPGSAQRGLLVANLNVAPGQEVEQLAIVPQLAQSD